MRIRISVVAVLACAMAALLVAPARAEAGLIAPARACPNQTDAALPKSVQERAIRCMVNYARARSGLRRLKANAVLGRSARRKSVDMIQCNAFDHEACGRDFTYWIERMGYPKRGCWSAAENIAWGVGEFATPRAIFTGWMRSPGHRTNILHPSFRDLGVGLKIGRLEDVSGAFVWTQHFGVNC